MTKISIVIAVIFLVVGYLLGNFVPLSNFSDNNQVKSGTGNTATNIPNGKGTLKVTVKNSSNQPMVGIEIDVGVKPGPPESWGVKEADANGTAEFQLDPGTYFVFFNTSRFPLGYKVQPEQKVDIQEGQTKNIVIVLEKN